MTISLAKNLPEIDGLRAFACFAVVFYHYPFSDNLLQVYGWVGVDLFFVISGFLITGILLRSRVNNDYFHNFYVRRVLRIWPLYYFVITIIFVTSWMHVTSGPAPQKPYWIYASHLQNLLGPLSGPPRSLLVTWSLGVEEQFYLLWPLICWKTPRRVLAGICIALLILAPVSRIVAIHAGWDASRIRYFPLCCVDGLAGGSLLALWIATAEATLQKLRWFSLPAIVVGTIMFSILSKYPDLSLGWALSFSFLAIAFCGLVGLSLSFGSLVSPHFFIPYLGRISYGLYLYHALVLAAVARLVRRDYLVPYVALALTIAVASLSFHFFESPISRLKNRFAPVH